MENSTPIIIVGAAGRMGRMILKCALEEAHPFELIAAVEAAGSPAAGRDLSSLLLAIPQGQVIADAMPAEAPEGAVAIYFSTPEGVMAHWGWAERGGAAVIGATGFTQDQLARIHAAAERAPILLAPNMSLGVNVLFDLVARAAKMLGEGFDVEITEMHHRDKIDAPSGTANRLAQIVLDARGQADSPDLVHGRSGVTGRRRDTEIAIHALRGGDVTGEHTVTLAGPGERIELTHRAHTRETFARGALQAARWLSGRPPGLYEMRDVLGIAR